MKHFLPWKIVHVAVRERLPDLDAEPGLGGLFVVFWCDSVPVGELRIPASLLPITSLQLVATVPPIIARVVGNRIFGNCVPLSRAVYSPKEMSQKQPPLARLLDLRRPLESCSSLVSGRKSESPDVPSVSIVICTRNRPEALQKCLASIRNLLPQPDEIVVVDNDPSSGLTPAVTTAFPEVRYVSEPRSGLSKSRNTGVRNSRGAIIAFTDDDVTVHSGWIQSIRNVFYDPDVIAMTGLVLPAELTTPAQLAFQSDCVGWELGYDALDFDQNFFRSTERTGVPVWRIGAGANMAFRREAFERVGFFDERLGAGASGCSEDSELWYRLLADGHRLRYEPAAVVFHAHRADWKEVSDQSYSYMRGHVAALLFQFQSYGHWGNVRRAFWSLPIYFMRLVLRSFTRTIGTIIAGAQEESLSLPLAPQIRGVAAGYAYFIRNRHFSPDQTKPHAGCEEAGCPPIRPQ